MAKQAEHRTASQGPKSAPAFEELGARPRRIRVSRDWRAFEPEEVAGSPFALELATYAANLDMILAQSAARGGTLAERIKRDSGGFVLIAGREIVGVFDSRDEAAAEAVRRFGKAPVLIKRINERESPVDMGGI